MNGNEQVSCAMRRLVNEVTRAATLIEATDTDRDHMDVCGGVLQ